MENDSARDDIENIFRRLKVLVRGPAYGTSLVSDGEDARGGGASAFHRLDVLEMARSCTRHIPERMRGEERRR
jgi:hypothetical protein